MVLHSRVVLMAVLAIIGAHAAEALGQDLTERARQAAARRISVTPEVVQLKREALARPLGPDAFVPSELECVTVSSARNVNLDCDHPFLPKNEPDIEVDPADPLHMVVSANDYESCCDQFYTTFDGGQRWFTGDMSVEDDRRIGSDPVTTFDPKSGRVLHASLNFLGRGDDSDVVVSPSKDGGVTWLRPVEVADGSNFGDPGDFLSPDKEWMVTDVNPSSPFYGRTYVTWTAFRFGASGFEASPIFEAHSSDGGQSWSTPKEISGRNGQFCTFQISGGAGRCDEDQSSVGTIAPDGTLYVAFENTQHQAAWEPGEVGESQYLVVRSRDGGATFSDPVHVVDLEDGSADYPQNVDRRPTLTGFQVRVGSDGYIVADPRTGKLFLVFSDNRAGRHDVRNPVTDTNVFLMTSADGVTWTGPFAVSDAPGDQWFPWADVNPVTGDLGVVYNDRSVVSSADLYGVTLSTGTAGAFTRTALSRYSDPVHSLFFRAFARDCPRCSTFHGDYIGLDYGSDGSANAVWTQMSRFFDLGGRTGFTEDIFFSRR